MKAMTNSFQPSISKVLQDFDSEGKVETNCNSVGLGSIKGFEREPIAIIYILHDVYSHRSTCFDYVKRPWFFWGALCFLCGARN